MSSNAQCLFCRIIDGEIPSKKVFEDDEVVAFHDVTPQAPTHVLVIPRRHIASLDDMTDDDAATIGRTALRLTKIARELGLSADGYRVVVNNGPGAGQTVFHVHFHLLGGRKFSWPPG
jgi:histidine triad (HIT) family protein